LYLCLRNGIAPCHYGSWHKNCQLPQRSASSHRIATIGYTSSIHRKEVNKRRWGDGWTLDILTVPISITDADMHKGPKYGSNLNEFCAMTMGIFFLWFCYTKHIRTAHLHAGCSDSCEWCRQRHCCSQMGDGIVR